MTAAHPHPRPGSTPRPSRTRRPSPRARPSPAPWWSGTAGPTAPPSLHRPATGRRIALQVALTSLVAVVAAGALLAERPRAPATAAPAALGRASAPAVGAPSAPDVSPRIFGLADGTPRSGFRAAPPVRLRIPALHLDTALDALSRRADGTLSTPPRWEIPGWYTGGPRPGEQGPAVIAGHVDSTAGPAVFFGLHRLRPGAAVDVVERGGRVLHFAVGQIDRVPKNRFPTALVYGPQPLPVLRLITCTGRFDRTAGGYRDNLVVSAYLRSGRSGR